jgi:hypothetical protein
MDSFDVTLHVICYFDGLVLAIDDYKFVNLVSQFDGEAEKTDTVTFAGLLAKQWPKR